MPDNEAPIATRPATVPSVTVDQGMANASVTWSPAPSAYDVVEGTITAAGIICRDGSGSVVSSGGKYGVGTTSVTCSASDSVPLVGSCQFTITVVGTSYLGHGKHLCSL